MTTAIQILTDIIREHGAIPTVRVSSAQARGYAKQYSYWGAVRYRIRLSGAGLPANMACERASSDRRSERLAHRDAEQMMAREGRIYCHRIGTLDEGMAADVVTALAGGVARVAIARQVSAWRAIPHWAERVAAKTLAVHERWLTTSDLAAISACRVRRTVVREQRAKLRRCAPPARRICVRVQWRGVVMYAYADRDAQAGQRVRYAVSQWSVAGDSPRAAVAAHQRRRNRPIGRQYTLMRTDDRWALYHRRDGTARVSQWDRRPTRGEIADAIRAHRAIAVSRTAPDTLGWRAWTWDALRGVLRSPHIHTPWHEPELSADDWSDDAAVRGVAGVHARRMPRDWRRASLEYQEGPAGPGLIHGVVERYGRYVLGATGWRAERVMIRELQAPDMSTYIALTAHYPEVRVHPPRSLEGKS